MFNIYQSAYQTGLHAMLIEEGERISQLNKSAMAAILYLHHRYSLSLWAFIFLAQRLDQVSSC